LPTDTWFRKADPDQNIWALSADRDIQVFLF